MVSKLIYNKIINIQRNYQLNYFIDPFRKNVIQKEKNDNNTYIISLLKLIESENFRMSDGRLIYCLLLIEKNKFK